MKKIFYAVVLAALLYTTVSCADNADGKSHTEAEFETDALVQEEIVQSENSSADAPSEPLPYEVSEPQVLMWTYGPSGYFQVFVPVKNIGDVPLAAGDATFEAKDADGDTMFSLKSFCSYPQIIEPGEPGYFTEIRSFARGEINFSDISQLVATVGAAPYKSNIIDLPITDIKINSGIIGKIKVSFKVENPTNESVNSPYIGVFLFDKDSKFIGFMDKYTDINVSSGKARTVQVNPDQLPPSTTIETTDTCLAFAYELVFPGTRKMQYTTVTLDIYN